MEYLPHNGNAFDSSVSELLNLRAAGASGAFAAPKKSASRRAMCLYVVSLSVPFFFFFFCAIAKLLRALSNWTPLSAS